MIGNISVSISLGRADDTDLGLVVKAKDIQVGTNTGGPSGHLGSFGITIQEATSSENVEHWPSVSMTDPGRRAIIYDATSKALRTAEGLEVKEVGFFTMGLEVGRIPTWETAEEIVKAVHAHAKNAESVERIALVASSPTQVSSFQYALDNIKTITYE
jgi:O-acetyl-ADP-ribose deacetylase (regulator of RNase III)